MSQDLLVCAKILRKWLPKEGMSLIISSLWLLFSLKVREKHGIKAERSEKRSIARRMAVSSNIPSNGWLNAEFFL